MTNQQNDSYRSDPDNQLLLRTGSGDVGAFKLLMEKHQLTVMRMVYRYTGRHHEAEDLAQDIFLKLYRAARRYTPRAHFKTWLYKVVANHCLNFHRSQKKHLYGNAPSRSFSETEVLPRSCREAGETPPAEQRLEQEELKAAVKQALAELPDRQRMAIILFRFEELSYREIAQALGCSLPAVESLIFRAMRTLKDALKPHYNQL